MDFIIFENITDYTMKIILYVFFFFVFIPKVHSQEWVIVDIVNQNSKELSVMIDDGEKINRKKIKNPSIVNLINEYQNNGFTLEKVTSGIELDINGNIPLISNNRGNNFGFSNLTFSNNNRIMLWFKKE